MGSEYFVIISASLRAFMLIDKVKKFCGIIVVMSILWNAIIFLLKLNNQQGFIVILYSVFALSKAYFITVSIYIQVTIF